MDQNLIYFLIILAVSFGLTMLALVDIILKNFSSVRAKVIWHFVAIIPFIGWLLYFIIGARQGTKRKPGQDSWPENH